MRNIEITFLQMLPIIDKALNSWTDSMGNISKTGKKPKFSDTKVIALNLASEFMAIDSENRLFNILNQSPFFSKHGHIERSVFNRRRHKLYYYYNKILDILSTQLSPFENAFIVDSLPIEICRFARARRLKICKDNYETAPEFGFCASQRNTYFGYKLHAVCSVTGVFQQITISKANIADIHYLQDIRDDFTNCIFIGDKGYLSQETQMDLFNKDGIRLFTPKKSNQKNNQYPPVFRRLRKRIETSFSQLCDQFMMKRNYAKKFIGLATRIVSKILSFTVAQYQNKFVNHKNLSSSNKCNC